MITPDQLIGKKGQPAGSTLDQPLEHLSACHRRIEQRLATLERAADHLGGNEGRDAIASALRFLDGSGVLHTVDEEKSVFPRLLPRLDGADRRDCHQACTTPKN